MPGRRDTAATAHGGWGSAVPDVPCALAQPVPRSLQEMILIPEGDAEPSLLSLPAPGCSQPVPQAFPRSAACQALRRLRLSAVRGPDGGCSVLAAAAPRPAASAESPARAKNLRQPGSRSAPRSAPRCPASPSPCPVAGHPSPGWHLGSLRETRLAHEQ